VDDAPLLERARAEGGRQAASTTTKLARSFIEHRLALLGRSVRSNREALLPHTAALLSSTEDRTLLGLQGLCHDQMVRIQECRSRYEGALRRVSEALATQVASLTDSSDAEEGLLSREMKKFAKGDEAFLGLLRARDDACAQFHAAMESFCTQWTKRELEGLRGRLARLASQAQACALELHLFNGIEEYAETAESAAAEVAQAWPALAAGPSTPDGLLALVATSTGAFQELCDALDESRSRMCCCLPRLLSKSASPCPNCGAEPAKGPAEAWYVSRWLKESVADLGGAFLNRRKQIRELKEELLRKEREVKYYKEDNFGISKAQVAAFEQKINLQKARESFQFAQRLLVDETSYLAKLATGPFPELPYALPEAKLQEVELADIVNGLVLVDRCLDDYTIDADDGKINASCNHIIFKATFAGRPVVLKEYALPYANESPKRQFWRETRLLAKLASHNGFADITGVFVDQVKRKGYVEMPFYHGNLLDVLRERSPRQCVVMFQRIAEALAYLHGEGIVHCDVKPENVLINDRGMPLVADFDMAHDVNGRASMQTLSSARGTPEYMAPEVQKGDEPTAASDVFSYGRLLERCMQLRGEPLSLDTNLQNLVGACLADDPSKRPPFAAILERDVFLELTAAELARDMDERDDADATMQAQADAERRARHRTCASCFYDDVDVSEGIQCSPPFPGQESHFTCDECFGNLVSSEARKPSLSLRWVEVAVEGEERTRWIRRCASALEASGIPGLEEERFSVAWREFRADPLCDLTMFAGAFVVVQESGDEFCIPCRATAEGGVGECGCFFEKNDVAKHLAGEAAATHRRALQDLAADRVRREEQRKWERELELERQASDLQRLVRRVQEDVLTTKCPGCGQAMGTGADAFEACAALTCAVAHADAAVAAGGRVGCGAKFCAFCLEFCARDAHGHVRNCEFNPQPGRVFVSSEQYKAAVKARQERGVTEFLRNIADAALRGKLKEALRTDLEYLGIDVERLLIPNPP